jgi:hypothetical protein
VVVTGAPFVIALADGLGHGEEAATAADAFCSFVRDNPSLPPLELLAQGGRAIAHTRGAAAAVLRVEPLLRRLSFAAVGNIDVRSHGSVPFRPLSAPGIVGRPVRKVLPFDHTFAPGDLVVMHSDGVSSRLELGPLSGLDTQSMAERIVRDFGKDHDDASCVVLRC